MASARRSWKEWREDEKDGKGVTKRGCRRRRGIKRKGCIDRIRRRRWGGSLRETEEIG